MAVQDVTTADQAGVDTKSLGYKSMEGFWPMVEALESTEGMRAMASEFLPAEPKESPDKYEARIQRSWLFPAYWNTVKEFSDAPYRTPVVIKDGEGMPEPLKLAEKDVDKEGRTLTQFMRSVLRAAIHYGVSHILPEFPAARPGLTLGEERKKNIRPYLTHVTAKDLRAWPLEVGPDGIERVRALRIHSETVEADGAYGETTVERIRVYNLAYPDQAAARATSHTVLSGQSLSVEEVAAMTGQPGTIEVHEKTKTEDGEAYVLREVIPYTYVGFPLVPLYTNRTGLLTGTPAMQELAETNVEHFQSESDQTNQLHFARVPIFSRTGITDEEKELGFAIGAGKSIDSNNADAKFAWVEHKGTAIASGRTHGLDIQDKMEALKAKARNRTGGDPKAMIAAIAEERGMSSLETWALDSGDAAELAYHKMAEFIGKQMPADFKVTVTTKNLALDPRADAKVEILRKVRADGNLSRETLLNEMRRHASVSEDLDVPAELERIKQEGMDAADEFLRTTTAAPEVDENGDEVQPKPTLSTPPAA